MSYSRSDEGTHKNISLQIKKKKQSKKYLAKNEPCETIHLQKAL